MVSVIRIRPYAAFASLLFLSLMFLFVNQAIGSEVLMSPKMPSNWVIQSDVQLPADQVKRIGMKLGARLTHVQNTIYRVDGMRVQINVILAKDTDSAEDLMKALRSIKAEQALLQKGRTVYEFVGQNDVLPLIAQGRQHLDKRHIVY